MAVHAMCWRLSILLLLCAAAPACGKGASTAAPSADRTPDLSRTTAVDRPATAAAAAAAAPDAAAVSASVEALLEEAAAIAPLKAVVVAHDGSIVGERGYRGSTPATPTNIKSASKSVVSALVGIAIDRGILAGVDQRIAPLLEDRLPADPDPRLASISIGHLLSMQAGLERTSGANYGRWVSSRDWVRDALARPFVDEPGGAMLYSTGSTHLLSAILASTSGRPTLALAREWLGPQPGFVIASWDRDPQGIHFGGNNMAMSTRSLLAFGELYRNGGRTPDGRRLLSQAWIDASWQPRTASRYTGDGYGYGWFLRDIAGEPVRYAWGYGGQMLYIVPSLRLTVAMTSDDSAASARTGHRDALHGLMAAIIEAVRPDATQAPSGQLEQGAGVPALSPPARSAGGSGIARRGRRQPRACRG
jgi:CubicO group peptidase (beta-lactamase class C family)